MPIYIELSNGGFAAGFYPWELEELKVEISNDTKIPPKFRKYMEK